MTRETFEAALFDWANRTGFQGPGLFDGRSLGICLLKWGRYGWETTWFDGILKGPSRLPPTDL